MVKIFHKKTPELLIIFKSGISSINLEEYSLVAEVDVNDLELAYLLTQNLGDRFWTKNKEVSATSNKFRSTIAGDVFEHNGKYHIVKNVEFKTVKIQ